MNDRKLEVPEDQEPTFEILGTVTELTLEGGGEGVDAEGSGPKGTT